VEAGADGVSQNPPHGIGIGVQERARRAVLNWAKPWAMAPPDGDSPRLGASRLAFGEETQSSDNR